MSRILFFVNNLDFFLSHRSEIANNFVSKGDQVSVFAIRHKGIRNPTDHLDKNIEVAVLSREFSDYFTLIFLNCFKIRAKILKFDPAVIYLISPLVHIFVGNLLSNSPVRKIFVFAGLGRLFGNSLLSRVLFFPARLLYRRALRSKVTTAIFQKKSDHLVFEKATNINFSKLKIIEGSGVSDAYFFQREEINRKNIKVGMASRLLIEKGVLDYIEAAKKVKSKLPEAEFFLVGQKEAGILSIIPNKKIFQKIRGSPVQYLGNCADMPGFLRSIDLFVYPSRYMEGIPKVLLEAMAAELPIITTDWPGCRDPLHRDNWDFIFNPGDTEMMAQIIEKLVSNPELMADLSKKNSNKAFKEYRVEYVVEKYFEFHRTVVSLPPYFFGGN